MKKAIVLMLAVVLFFATSCSTTYRTVREPNVKVELYSTDYVLSGQATGQATITRVFGIDWARLFGGARHADINASIMGNVIQSDESFAIYDMLEKNPGYDFVMYPQITRKTKGIPWLFIKTEITATARLGRLISK